MAEASLAATLADQLILEAAGMLRVQHLVWSSQQISQLSVANFMITAVPITHPPGAQTTVL